MIGRPSGLAGTRRLTLLESAPAAVSGTVRVNDRPLAVVLVSGGMDSLVTAAFRFNQ